MHCFSRQGRAQLQWLRFKLQPPCLPGPTHVTIKKYPKASVDALAVCRRKKSLTYVLSNLKARDASASKNSLPPWSKQYQYQFFQNISDTKSSRPNISLPLTFYPCSAHFLSSLLVAKHWKHWRQYYCWRPVTRSSLLPPGAVCSFARQWARVRLQAEEKAGDEEAAAGGRPQLSLPQFQSGARRPGWLDMVTTTGTDTTGKSCLGSNLVSHWCCPGMARRGRWGATKGGRTGGEVEEGTSSPCSDQTISVPAPTTTPPSLRAVLLSWLLPLEPWRWWAGQASLRTWTDRICR